jgi:hypothetical protein
MTASHQLSIDDALAQWMGDDAGVVEGRRRRDEGMAATEAADTDGHDKDVIDAAIASLNAATWRRGPWSANDLRRKCPNVRQPLIGARVRSWAKRGLIVHVGYTPSDLPSTHAHDIKTWRAA